MSSVRQQKTFHILGRRFNVGVLGVRCGKPVWSRRRQLGVVMGMIGFDRVLAGLKLQSAVYHLR